MITWESPSTAIFLRLFLFFVSCSITIITVVALQRFRFEVPNNGGFNRS